jgi:hypothetical protein
MKIEYCVNYFKGTETREILVECNHFDLTDKGQWGKNRSGAATLETTNFFIDMDTEHRYSYVPHHQFSTSSAPVAQPEEPTP